MSDQALAQNSELKRSAGSAPVQQYTLSYKVAWRCKVIQCWLRYVIAGRHKGVLGLVDFVLGNHYFRAIQKPGEIAALGEILAERRPQRALEVGTAQGGTLFLLTRLASPHAKIISVDLPGGMFGGGYSALRKWFYLRFAHRNQKLHLLRGDSHSVEMFTQIKDTLAGELLDYLFIDGDHRYEGVKGDFTMYGPLVRKGGLIVFHDIVEGRPEAVGGVPQFWSEVKPLFRHVEFIQDPQQGGFGVGVIFIPDNYQENNFNEGWEKGL